MMVIAGRLRRGSILGTMMIGLSASGALAEQCVFTEECFESEACSESAFTVSIEDGQLVTDAETILTSSGGSDTVRAFVGVTASAMHLLTREASGAARYSTHIFSGPIMVNYLGTCE